MCWVTTNLSAMQVGISASFYINDVEESTIWNEINLTYNLMK